LVVTGLLGSLAGAALAGSLVLLVAAVRGWKPNLQRASGGATQGSGTVGALVGTEGRRRLALAIGAALLVLLLTRWPVAAGAAAALIWLWPTMFGGRRAGAAQIERIEALATWTESLRDTIAGAVGLEQAIAHSVDIAPAPLVLPLQRLRGQLDARIPLVRALDGLAEDLDDPSADLVVITLKQAAQLRGPGLVAALTRLATTTRQELEMRRRIDEGRKKVRRGALVIVCFAGGLGVAMAIGAPTFVEPYGTPTGQLMLAIVLGVFAAGLMWMRSSAEIKQPARLLRPPAQVPFQSQGGSR
jgi:Flp pilus assembly protein TadB